MPKKQALQKINNREIDYWKEYFALKPDEMEKMIRDRALADMLYILSHPNTNDLQDADDPKNLALRSTEQYQKLFRSMRVGVEINKIVNCILENDIYNPESKTRIQAAKFLCDLGGDGIKPFLAVQINNRGAGLSDLIRDDV